MAVDFLQNGAEAFQDDPLAFAQKAENWIAENWIYEGLKWAGRRIVHQWRTGWAELKAAPGAVIHRTWQETRGAISLALDFIPIVGDIKGIIEAKVGTDLAGNKLSEAEKGLMLAGALVGMFTIADELMDVAKLGRQLLTNADNAAGLLKASKGLDNLEEAAAVGKGLKNSALKQAADFDNAKATFRNADDLAIANRLDNLDDFTGGRRTADEAAQMRDRLARNSDQGALSRRLDNARARRQADEVGASCAYNSFTEGTPVHTDEGQKPIEDIAVGDKVLAEDPETGDDKRGYFEVVALTSHAEADILHITIEAEAKDKAEKTATLDSGQDNGHNDDQQLNSDDAPPFQPSTLPTFHITPDHPVYVEGPGWLWAENLAVGDTLRRGEILLTAWLSACTMMESQRRSEECRQMETLILQEASLVEEVRRLTEQEGLDSEDFLAEAVRRHLATFRQKRLVAETEAWYRLPPAERQRYEGLYVAVYHGQVVDSDADRMTLYYRVREKYGRQTILITPGGDQPLPVYRVRSPRRGSDRQ